MIRLQTNQLFIYMESYRYNNGYILNGMKINETHVVAYKGATATTCSGQTGLKLGNQF